MSPVDYSGWNDNVILSGMFSSCRDNDLYVGGGGGGGGGWNSQSVVKDEKATLQFAIPL